MTDLRTITNKDDTVLVTFGGHQIKFDGHFFKRIERIDLGIGETAWNYYKMHGKWKELRAASHVRVICPGCGDNIAFLFKQNPEVGYYEESCCPFCLQPVVIQTRVVLDAVSTYRPKSDNVTYEDA